MSGKTVMLVAAEASGDTLGAGLVRALRKKRPDLRFIGVGGRKMLAEGIESPFDISELSILGLFEGLAAYPKVKRRVRDTAALARAEKPDIAILIDSWGFTLRVAHALRRDFPQVPLIKYVGPQIWATRPGRAKTLAASVDHLLSILPFDEPFYAAESLPVTFVGNPALADEPVDADGARFRKAYGLSKSDQILLVLPGSRTSEIQRVFPAFSAAVMALRTSFPDLKVVIPVASTVVGLVREHALAAGYAPVLVEDEADKRDAMKAGTVALACSGTVTTELGLSGVPMVVGYRIGGATYAIAKRLAHTQWVVLMNIAAQREVVPEFIQDACNGESLSAAIGALLSDPKRRSAQIAEQNAALDIMGRGGPDPADKASDVVLSYLDRR